MKSHDTSLVFGLPKIGLKAECGLLKNSCGNVVEYRTKDYSFNISC